MQSTNKTTYSTLVDIPKLQALMESFSRMMGVANAVIDVHGVVITQAGWQDACTGFHRVHPDTCRRCIASDTSLAERMTRGAPFAVYRCHNGLVDAAAPIIVNGAHLANVFTGQFLTEEPDLEFFRRQAAEFGFDEGAYLEAIARVPVLPYEKAESLTRLYAQLAALLADNGVDHLKQLQATEKLEDLNKVLEETVGLRTRALEVANATLVQQDAMHRRILDTASVAIFLVDPSGRIVQANQRMAEMFGKSVEALQGSAYISLLHPSERAQGLENMSALIANAVASVDVDRLYLRADETVFWGRLTGKHFFDASGVDHGLIGVIADINERKLAQESLEETREKYRGLSEAAFEAIFISEKGLCLEQNRRAEYMFGYTDDEALGQLGTQWIAPDDRDRVMNNMKTGYELPYEVMGLRKDGSSFPAIIRGKMMHYKGRTVRVTSMSDITERKQAEEALRRSETKFRTLYDSTDDAVMMLDEKGFLGCNKAALELFGCATQEEFCTRHPGDYSPRQQPDGTASTVLAAHHIAVALAQGSNRFEWLHQRADNGGVFTADVLLSAMALDGKPVLQATVRNISDRKAAEDKIKSLAFYDPLTRLPNRRLLLDRLEQALAASARHQRGGALLFIDLDNFKTLNDTMGHGIGDMLLEQAAQRLVTCIREADTVARLGGDEFVVVLEDLSESIQGAATQAEAVGVKILAALNQPYQLAEIAHRSSASIGVTLFNDRQESIDELMRRADLAMYQAKSAGRNTLRFFDPEMQAVITSRAAMEAALGEALQKDQFVLYYQAQVTGERLLTGVEVLVRWRHPQRGLVPPGEFIPLAEETGLILPLGHWVLETACAQLARWAKRPEMAHLTVAVNVSSLQFRSADFVTEVLSILEHTGANPQRLKLELTESLMVSDVEDIITKMGCLKARGVGFSLDDFGTGYSSLSYLKRLPLTQLKIDQGFVRDILIDPNDAAIAKMVVALADSMGLSVIAEGVETEAQRDFLARQGCSAYQGYLFSRPVPLAEFEVLVTGA